jgi:hypothetical protein
MDKKRLERQLEYVRYSFYALSMFGYVLIGALEYNKVLSNRSTLGLLVGIVILNWPGLRALSKIEEYLLLNGRSETGATEVLNEGMSK